MKKTIKERAIEFSLSSTKKVSDDMRALAVRQMYDVYIHIATEQGQIDHSEEHLNWIIEQYKEWSNRNDGVVDKTEMSFKEWIDTAMERNGY